MATKARGSKIDFTGVQNTNTHPQTEIDESPPLPLRNSVTSKQKKLVAHSIKEREKRKNKRNLRQHELVSTEYTGKNDEIDKDKSEIYGRYGYLSPQDLRSQSPKTDSQDNQRLNENIYEEIQQRNSTLTNPNHYTPETNRPPELPPRNQWQEKISSYLPVSILSISDVKKENPSTQKHPEQDPGSAKPIYEEIPADREEKKSEGFFSVGFNWVVNGIKSFFSDTHIIEHQDTEEKHVYTDRFSSDSQNKNVQQQTDLLKKTIDQDKGLEESLNNTKLAKSEDSHTPPAQQSWTKREEKKHSETEKSRL